ncbi:MAG: D-alanine--D-alanine ligase family protein [Bacilli bacterium]
MRKLNVAVLFGGISEEHDVSVKSAAQIAAALDREKYEPYFVGITKEGEWRLCDEPTPHWAEVENPTAMISPNRAQKGLIIFEGEHMRRVAIDVVLPIIHGKMGEDGKIQGLLELSGIPYAGCGIGASILAMDKSLAHVVARSAGVLTPNHTVVLPGQSVDSAAFTYPVFVKPARSGSSFGVNKVSEAHELAAAIADARLYDVKVLIEEAITGEEVGCAVLGNGTTLITGEVDMITLSSGFFRIHQESSPETGSVNANIAVPAPVSKEVSDRIKETGKKIYIALGCQGLARVDMFLQSNGDIVLNEVNTMPGCTSYSRYPRMMRAAGIELGEIIDRLIELALGAHPDA